MTNEELELIIEQNDGGSIEIDQRDGPGLKVTLVRSRRHGNLMVLVNDLAEGRSFLIQARPDNAKDVFDHPFAYAT